MLDQKPMRIRCLGGFSVIWVTNLWISPVKIRIFCPRTTKFGRKLDSQLPSLISLFIFVWSISFRSKSKEQLNERRAGLSISSLFSHDNLKNANWRKNIFENIYNIHALALCIGWTSSSRGIRIAMKVNCQVQKKDFTTTWMAHLKNVLRATKSHRWCQHYEAYSDMNGTCPTHLLNIRKNCPLAHLMQLNFHILSKMTWKRSLYSILCNGLPFLYQVIFQNLFI